MSNEILSIFDDNMNCIGQTTRDEVHSKGYWHQTFHCWFTILEDGEYFVLLQKRAIEKKDYPSLLDITSAGHLLASENVNDGIREVEEELGIPVKFDDLISLGIIKKEIKLQQIWDREISHVFLYECNALPKFELQKDEVDSIHKVRLDDVLDLFNGELSEVEVTEIGGSNNKQTVNKESFVPNDSYFIKVFELIQEKLGRLRGMALKRRLVYFSLSIISFIACIIIVKLFSNNPFVRGFIGDIIVIFLIYFLIKAIYDFNAFKLAIFTLFVAFATEFLQYLKLTAFLGLEHNKMARLILGSTFDPYDLLAYSIGAISVYIIDTRLVKKANLNIR